jgi:hypothetical protein
VLEPGSGRAARLEIYRLSLNLIPDIPFRNLTGVTDVVGNNLHTLILVDELHLHFVKDFSHPPFP